MKMETRKVADLQVNPHNPRRISDKALTGLAVSIERWGLVQPVIVNQRTGNVVGGHQRLAILQRKGILETDCVIVDLPDAEERALNVALNNPGITGRYDDSLPELMESIVAELPDLPIVDLQMDKYLPDDLESGPELEQQFQILIDCATEQQQAELLERLTKDGITCHALIG